MKKYIVLAILATILPISTFAQSKETVLQLQAKVAALEEEIALLKSSNPLYGKKWVACGDSFTASSWSDKTATEDGEAVYDSELGMYKTYPYWIAKRNGMTLVNTAKGGATMANYKGDAGRSFCLEKYLNIPEDADYITLKFGINDSHKNIVIGDIDDDNDTTFCGAWNKVLAHILETHPYAKVGIIVSNGCDRNDYPDATIKIARKWGIPYLDEVYGNVPLLHRVTREGLVKSEMARKRKIFRVAEKNTHPNLKGHKWESTMVEAFLKSL